MRAPVDLEELTPEERQRMRQEADAILAYLFEEYNSGRLKTKDPELFTILDVGLRKMGLKLYKTITRRRAEGAPDGKQPKV